MHRKTARNSNHATNSKVRVVTTCSQRKALEPTHRIQDLGSLPFAMLAKEWISRLSSADADEKTLPAIQMYQGGHWSVVRSLEAEVWVCSAGYGLIPIDAGIQSYGATFSAGHPDSVTQTDEVAATSAEAAKRWWSRLAEWKGPSPGSPRSVAELAGAKPDAPLLVVVSADYLQALHADVKAARKQLRRPEQLMIVSIGASDQVELGDHMLPGDARFRSWLGGSMQSLNARVARAILESDWEMSVSAVRAHLNSISQQLEPVSSFDRTRRTDEQVRTFIRSELATTEASSHSRLLRKFRDLGFACEQSRFRRLYQQTKIDQLELLERKRTTP